MAGQLSQTSLFIFLFVASRFRNPVSLSHIRPVPDSAGPTFGRAHIRHESSAEYVTATVAGQDFPFDINILSVINTSSIPILLLFTSFK